MCCFVYLFYRSRPQSSPQSLMQHVLSIVLYIVATLSQSHLSTRSPAGHDSQSKLKKTSKTLHLIK